MKFNVSYLFNHYYCIINIYFFSKCDDFQNDCNHYIDSDK